MCFTPDSQPPVRAEAGASTLKAQLVLIASDGAPFAANAAQPRALSGIGLVILPDVRGLYGFYRELADRVAEHGHAAVAIDYFGRTAGVGERGDDFPFMEHVARLTREGNQANIEAAVAYLRSPAGGSCRAVFTLGFCMGGRMSWLAAAGHLDPRG